MPTCPNCSTNVLFSHSRSEHTSEQQNQNFQLLLDFISALETEVTSDCHACLDAVFRAAARIPRSLDYFFPVSTVSNPSGHHTVATEGACFATSSPHRCHIALNHMFKHVSTIDLLTTN